jgi:hypothetical protein
MASFLSSIANPNQNRNMSRASQAKGPANIPPKEPTPVKEKQDVPLIHAFPTKSKINPKISRISWKLIQVSEVPEKQALFFWPGNQNTGSFLTFAFHHSI